ncbi:ABC transporter substrate-binding protein [Fictibacillus terranigra]|uniref:ABC transporter substrate-binding protein n=1 Tax=Fictibacillus terranigra TaxID=3058424 RepID=A0ABT8E4N2_9BACL|nr:ABC transporter substrate-binding protein [Fictibacillus sp. CENA-BCM004]MDN4072861.1 ABC transporter substrate-binding protein [Fictibacillus sp. CENA-BCM004]
MVVEELRVSPIYAIYEAKCFKVKQSNAEITILNEMITLAGEPNVFGDIEKGWSSVSWEEVLNRNPDIIVFIDYGETTLEQKKNFLLNHHALSGVKAIKEERFVVLPLSAAAEGIKGPS